MASLASQSRKELLLKARQLVPPMLDHFHKGQLGRVAVLGGSEDYTGAPYFSAMASAKLGCDMSHVICDPIAAPIIKSYSPNLMVHPLMRSSRSASKEDTADQIADSVAAMMPRLHVLIIGPGLGRDPLIQKSCIRIVKHAKEKGIAMVLDADALQLLNPKDGGAGELDLLKGVAECIITPNVVEFGRLCKARDIPESKDEKDLSDTVVKLAKSLSGPTVLAKGSSDYISNGGPSVASSEQGGKKRSGGQGDTLTGVLGTLLAWRKAYHDGLWKTEGDLSKDETLALVAFAGSAITRECSRLAFEDKGRSMQAGDLTDRVHQAFLNLIGEPEESRL